MNSGQNLHFICNVRLTTALLLGALTKQLQRAALSFFKFARPYGTIWPLTEGFSLHAVELCEIKLKHVCYVNLHHMTGSSIATIMKLSMQNSILKKWITYKDAPYEEAHVLR